MNLPTVTVRAGATDDWEVFADLEDGTYALVPVDRLNLADLEDEVAFAIGQAVILDADFVRSRPMQLHDAAKAVLAVFERWLVSDDE